jgi:hypothetical protein
MPLMDRQYALDQIELRVARIESRDRIMRDALVRGFWQTTDRLDDLTLPQRRMVCPICDRSEHRETLERRIDQCMFGGGRLERYLCPGCGCVYGPAKYLDLSPELVAADYALLYLDYEEADSTENEIRAFRSLNARAGAPYLNWGCGRSSRTIPELRAEGYDVWGYEPTLASGRQFIVSDRNEISPVFQGLFSNNVIEHMTRPVEEFRFFHRILSPGSLMAHASPCYEYAYSFTRFHVVFLTGDASSVLAERSGFRQIDREDDGEFINCVFERL